MQLSPMKHIKRFDTLKAERLTWNDYWQNLAQYIIPRKSYITRTKVPGTRLDTNIYDSTAIESNKILAAGLHGYLTNPASRWFALRTQDKALMEARENKVWFKDAEDVMYDVLNSSNFDQQSHEVYLDLGCFGTATMYEEEDIKDKVRFKAIPISELYLVEDAAGRVIAVYREFEYTVSQAYGRWPKGVSDEITKAYNVGQFEKKFMFLHVVEERHEREVGKRNASNMPYRSLFIEVKKKKLVAEGGYEEFPYFSTRFEKESGETYGSSPGQTALPNIKMLNKMKYTMLRSGMKITDPPWIMPNDGVILPLNLNPGKLNFTMGQTATDSIRPLLSGAKIPISLELINEERRSIKQMFFVDLFMALTQLKKQMTVPEVMERISEKMLLLGPALGRLMSELLDPIITRTFNILLRTGELPPVPQQLQGIDYTIEYISPLAKAQRQGEITSMNNALSVIGEIAKFNQEVLDKIDTDKVADIVIDVNGVRPDIIRDDEEVQAIREGRAEAVAEAEELAKGQQAAEIAATAALADKNSREAVK